MKKTKRGNNIKTDKEKNFYPSTNTQKNMQPEFKRTTLRNLTEPNLRKGPRRQLMRRSLDPVYLSWFSNLS